MKKRNLLILLVMLVFSLSACGTKPSSEPAAEDITPTESFAPTGDFVTDIRQSMEDNDQMFAAAFLGWYGSNWEYLPSYLEGEFTEKFPFLTEITEGQFACGAGAELYLIIPRDPDASVAVNQLNTDGEVEEVLYRSESGEPVLIQGNLDTFTGENEVYNLEMHIVESDGNTLTCYPGLDFSYRGLVSNVPMLDLNALPMMNLESLGEDAVYGSWEGYVIPDDGRDSHTVSFEFFEDGTMKYAYALYTEEKKSPEYFYEGTWERMEMKVPDMPASVYIFDLELTRVTGDENPPAELHTTQYIAEGYDGISLQIVQGDDLYPSGWEYEVLLSR